MEIFVSEKDIQFILKEVAKDNIHLNFFNLLSEKVNIVNPLEQHDAEVRNEGRNQAINEFFDWFKQHKENKLKQLENFLKQFNKDNNVSLNVSHLSFALNPTNDELTQKLNEMKNS